MRLRYHFQFQNEKRLFAEVHHETLFSINVYGTRGTLRGQHIANLFSPSTISACFDHVATGPVPGIKTDTNDWNEMGHRRRIIRIDIVALTLFARLYEEPRVSPGEARLPALHATDLVSVLEKLRDIPVRVSDLAGRYWTTQMWYETPAVKKSTIRPSVGFPESANSLIVSGPHLHVSTPIAKTPRRVSTKNSDYDAVDLTDIPGEYLPRTKTSQDVNQLCTVIGRPPCRGARRPV